MADLADVGIARLGQAWQLLLKGHSEAAHAPDSAAGCEMLIIRLARRINANARRYFKKNYPQLPPTQLPPSPATLPDPPRRIQPL